MKHTRTFQVLFDELCCLQSPPLSFVICCAEQQQRKEGKRRRENPITNRLSIVFPEVVVFAADRRKANQQLKRIFSSPKKSMMEGTTKLFQHLFKRKENLGGEGEKSYISLRLASLFIHLPSAVDSLPHI